MEKIWGTSEVKLSPSYLGYLKLKYVLEDLREVQGRVLDAGCGGGGFAKAIKHYRPDWEVYGADISSEAIKKAKKDPQGVKFDVGNIYHLPYKDSFFDAVVVADVLEHLDNPKRALKEVSRVLKPSGVFSAFIPLEGSLFSLHFWLKKCGWRAKEQLAGHIQMFSKTRVEKFLTKNGLKVDMLRYSVHLLGQAVDVGYYTLMDFFDRKLVVGLEEDLREKPIFRVCKNLLASITNFESQFMNFISSETNLFIPGAGVHLKCTTLKK